MLKIIICLLMDKWSHFIIDHTRVGLQGDFWFNSSQLYVLGLTIKHLLI